MSSIGLLLVFMPSLALATAPVEATRPAAREQIGCVLGEPIYRDQLRSDFSVREELFRLISPALERYREEHRDEIEPTDAELDFAASHIRQQNPDKWRARDAERKKELAEIREIIADPDFQNLPADEREFATRRLRHLETSDAATDFARFILNSRKFNRHLYHAFGGGLIVWQQAGVEAFDAHHRWLETLEARGDFSITDPELRKLLYEYWTNERMHGSFLSTREKNPQAFEEFLNPAWFPAGPVEKP